MRARYSASAKKDDLPSRHTHSTRTPSGDEGPERGPPHPPFLALRPAARARARRPGSEAGLHRGRRRRRPGRARGLRREIGQAVPSHHRAWLNVWEYVIPFLALPPEVRRVSKRQNAIEALNRQLPKAIKAKGRLPQRGRRPQADLSRRHNPSWRGPARATWTVALLAFKIHFGDRVPDTAS